MRRRSHVLVLVFGAAAVLLLSAPALGDPTLVDTVALNAGNIQHAPVIAVDPAAPSRAVVLADDGTISPPPHTATTTTTDWSAAWAGPGALAHSGSTSAGQADVAWGIDSGTDQNVYAVELGSVANSLCMTNAGIFLSASDNGGASYDTALPVATAGSNFSQVVEPAIAVDRTVGRVYVAYTRLDWGSPGCGGAPDGSQIWLAYSDIGTPGFGTQWTTRRVSPLATSGSAHYRSPAIAVLPDGRVVVAMRNEASPTPQIESETCVSPSPGANYCNLPSAGSVGPSVVVGDATAPALVDGVVGTPTPSVVAAGGRVVVAWHASVANGVRALAAMSTSGGASYGPAQQIDPFGAGSQIAPSLAATAGGRVDAAYLWDAGSASVKATVASAGPPLAGATTEAWAQPVVVQAVGASSATPIFGQVAPLGRRIGVATAAVVAPASPLPATVVAYTDTQNGGANQDVRVVGLLHGTTAPVIAPQMVTASKNTTTIVNVHGSDDDGDPLTWSAGAGPTASASKVDIADAARGDFAFRAANVKGIDWFEAVANDGVAGHEARAMITVNIVNNPPEILCSTFFAREDTPLALDLTGCVQDKNQDPLTIELDNATGGSVERVAGTWRFIPAPGQTETGSFRLSVSDGDPETPPTRQRMIVTIAKAVGKVLLDVAGANKRRVITRGLPLRFSGHAQDATGAPITIRWTFGDGTPIALGGNVAHRFRREGTFTVKAEASNAKAQIRVVVRRRAVELMAPPHVVDGVLHVRVRTRAAGKLSFRVDSRSRTITVPAGSSQRTLQIQVTTGPLVRLSLRLEPSKSTVLKALSLRRLVLVSPLSAG